MGQHSADFRCQHGGFHDITQSLSRVSRIRSGAVRVRHRRQASISLGRPETRPAPSPATEPRLGSKTRQAPTVTADWTSPMMDPQRDETGPMLLNRQHGVKHRISSRVKPQGCSCTRLSGMLVKTAEKPEALQGPDLITALSSRLIDALERRCALTGPICWSQAE